LAAAIVLSSLTLEPRQTVLTAAGNLALILALPLLRPYIRLVDLGPSLAFVITLTALTLEVTRQRSRIEHERRKEAIQRERQLNEMSRLISGTLDLSGVLGSALCIATELVESDGGLLELLSEDGRSIEEVHSNNLPKTLESIFVPGHQGVTWVIAQTGQPLRLDRYADHPNAVEAATQYGLQGFIGAPVIAGEKVLGALSVFSLWPDKKFEDRDLQLLEAVARQTGVAIQNARLFAALRQRDAILEVVALEARQFLQSADLPGRIHTLLARLGRQTGSSHAYIFETHLGPGGQRLLSQTYHWTAIEHALPLDHPEFQNMVLDNCGLERWLDAMESGEPFYGARSQMSPAERAVLSPLGAMAILAMPIYVRAESEGGATGKLQWWGLIGLDDYRNERSWSEAEVDALRIVAGLLGAAIQRQRSDQAVQDRETLYRRAISAAGAVPYYQDHTLEKYIFIGDGIEALTGYRAAEITPPFWRSLGQNLVMRGEAAGLSPAEAEQQSLSGDLRVWNSDNLIRRRDGQARWVADAAIQIVGADDQSHGWVGILQDITERIQAEAEVRELNAALETRVRERTAELEAANKELEAFAYSVSHDLRAPLRAIDGYSRMLFVDYADRLDDDGRTFIDNVRQSAQNMAHLIEDLLQLSRVTRAELKRSRVDLSALGQAILNEYARQEPERATSVQMQPSMAAYGDPNLLRVVMENLLGNAWKFTSRTTSPRIEAGCSRADGATVYYVRDNGAGFDMRYVDKLFQPFQRLHAPSEFEGTGVGLATVQRIIRRHGGHIWAESAVDEGATFYFTLGE
jgi:PAS domain S-box-containing protein